ncbi:MAG: hypothetical protein ABF805_06645 [Bifidobacterium sp.]|uniref:hypothetical protein n=1 Tax=Bifidobacterium sp. TaxID=41200 RepID=UPI0039ED983D
MRNVTFLYWTQPFTTSVIVMPEESILYVDPVTAILQALRDLDEIEAVALLDTIISRNAHYRDLNLADLEAAICGPTRFKGKALGKKALKHCREGTDSLMESRWRMNMVKSHLPCPEVNYRIQHPVTQELWFADLAYPELKIAIEYQGQEFHTTKEALIRDSRKISALQGLNWNVITVTAEDMMNDSAWQRFVDTLQAVIASKKAQLR